MLFVSCGLVVSYHEGSNSGWELANQDFEPWPPSSGIELAYEASSPWLPSERGAGRARIGLAPSYVDRDICDRYMESLPYGREILLAAERQGLDALLLAAVVETESGFDPQARSQYGAVGLMQLLPTTAASLGVTDLEDPAANLDGGARYLSELLRRFDGDLGLALAAYNCGPTTVRHHRGVPPFRETAAFVRKVLLRYLSHQRSLPQATAS
jgi:soluble lytic murein transglycosylase-like protein